MADYFSISKGAQGSLAGKAKRAGQICYTTDESVLYVDIAGTDTINRQPVNAKSSFGLPFASAGTAANEFVATISNLKEITVGTTIILYNSLGAANAKDATLKLNGGTAVPIYYQGSPITAGKWPSHSVGLFVYNATESKTGCWSMVYSYGANTTYTPNSLGFGYGTCDTAAGTAAKVASVTGYSLVNGGIVAIKFSNDVTSASSTLNINNKGAKAIFFKNVALATNIIRAGDLVTFMYHDGYYHVLAIDRAQTVADATKGTLTFQGPGDTKKTFNGSANVTIGYADVNALPASTKYAAASVQGGSAVSADKVNSKLTIAGQTYDGSKAVTITAESFGLSQALVFKGVSKTALSDGATTKPITLSNDSSLTPSTGHVVLYGEYEYVWTGSAWERLGGDGSYALNSVTVSAGDGLENSSDNATGVLSKNVKIAHKQNTVTSSTATTAPTSYISGLTVDQFGHLATYTTYDARAQFLRSIQINGNSPIKVENTSLTASTGSTVPSTTITHVQVAGTKVGSTGECATSIAAGGNGTLNIPNITVDAYGHTTFNGNKAVSISIPNPKYKFTVASATTPAQADAQSVEYNPTTGDASIMFHAMKGATSSVAGFQGFVPKPAAGAHVKFLRGDGTWQFPVEWEDF